MKEHFIWNYRSPDIYIYIYMCVCVCDVIIKMLQVSSWCVYQYRILNAGCQMKYYKWTLHIAQWHDLASPQIQQVRWIYLIIYHQSHIKTWDSNCLAPIAQTVRPFGMNPKVWGSSPPQAETFSVPKRFYTFTRPSIRVSKMNGVAHTQLTFQTLTLLQEISIPPALVFKDIGQQMSDPFSSNV